MTITLPDEVAARVEALAKRCGFSTPDELLFHLIQDAEQDAALADLPGPPELTFRTPEELHTKLLEGLNSGPPIRVTPEFWEEQRRRLAQRRASRESRGGKAGAS